MPIKNEPTRRNISNFLTLARKPSWHEIKALLLPSISGKGASGLVLLFRCFSSQATKRKAFEVLSLAAGVFQNTKARDSMVFKRYCSLRKLPAEQE